ncbi:mediator of RNA polymerase II transcription subunit 25 isoform X1 [Benincasa hispida]|uniref:mediator of RNA polymerase II transcription subunit 25 isoform X1 n=1 Tax=Benincasa hispida TaxID=102211 RepID=UPI001901A996|nr:mediator of RNA polymerase II transcription subunit 25 isoform X1 [Benincasa hispida]
MAEKQLIVVVEGTAAMGPFWQTIVSDYIEKIVRSFCGNELTGQKPPTSNVEFSLVTFHTHGSYCGCLVQRTGWTRDVDIFTQWLSAIPFSGGGFSDGAIAEGLAEALMMFSTQPNGGQNQQTMDMQKHCILVAASNPYPLPTPVYRPAVQNLEQHDNGEPGSSQSYAETVAKSFSQCFISLSVICPKQLPKLRAIYTAGKRNPRAADPPIDNVKTPSYLVLISENFVEARAALSRPGITSLPANQSPVKMDISPVVPVTGPPTTTTPSVNGPIINRQPVSVANVPPATVKVEPNTVTSMTNGSGYPPHMPSVVRAASQGVPSMQTSSPLSSQEMITNNENTQDLKPLVNGVPQPVRPVGPANVSILNNISQARVMSTAALNGGTSIGLPSMGQTPMAMHVSNMISSGMGSSVPAAQNVFSSGQSGMTSINGSSTLTQVAPNSGISSLTSGNNNISGNSNIVTSQAVGNLQGGVSVSQSVPGISQGNLAGTQVVQSGIGVSQNVMSNLTQPGVSSGNGTMIPTPGMPQQVQNGMHSIGVNNAAANMPLPQHSAGALQQAQSKYVKFWEGNLSGQRQGQPVFITRMEGYRSASASDKLAANWPQTMQIVRLISQDHMNNKQYIGKADFLVFRAMNQHGFLGQLQEKKLCAVIQLPSQTLLLSVSDKACRLIGMLFPGDMVVFKPQIPSQQQQQHQMQQQMQQQLQQHPQLQQHQLSQLQHQLPQMQQQQPQLSQLQQQQQQQQQQPLPQLQQQQQQQQLPQIQQQQQQQPQLSQLQSQQMQQQQQQQQMVTGGIGQSYVQGGRSQLVSQGQVSSQGQSNMPGGSFMG